MSFNYHHDEALEAIARKVISQHDPHLLSTIAAIPVEIIMEKVYGLTFEYQYIRKYAQILGETVFEDAEIPIYERRNNEGYKLIFVKAGTVIIDASLLGKRNIGRLRFTCAHELSHWVIDREYFTQLGETAAMTIKTARSSDTSEAIERQANRLACRILMPKCTIKSAFYQFFKITPNSIALTAYIAGIYAVSHQAMDIRLRELGLI